MNKTKSNERNIEKKLLQKKWKCNHLVQHAYKSQRILLAHIHIHAENTMHSIELNQLQWAVDGTWLWLKSPPSLESFTNRVGYDFDGKQINKIKTIKPDKIVDLKYPRINRKTTRNQITESNQILFSHLSAYTNKF